MEEKLNLKQQLQTVLLEEIPITQFMQLSVASANSERVELHAPLAANINHKQTAFGGSLYSLAVLAGWSMVYIVLEQLKARAHIVIHRSEIDYLQPVTATIVAECIAPSEQQLVKFKRMLNRYGKARLSLEVQIQQAGKLAVQFTGEYVVHQ